MRSPITCPYLKEVVMLYCDACHVKKMVPLDHLASANPCLGQDYRACPLYRDILARLGETVTEENDVQRGAFVTAGREIHQ